MDSIAIEAAANEMYEILLSHDFTVRQAHDAVSLVRNRIFENITERREALNDERIK